jgi:hypothetical protein
VVDGLDTGGGGRVSYPTMNRFLSSLDNFTNIEVPEPPPPPADMPVSFEIPEPVLSTEAKLAIPGQGAAAFEIERFPEKEVPESYCIRLQDARGKDVLRVTVFNDRIVDLLDWTGKVTKSETGPTGRPLVKFEPTSVFVWVSVDRAHDRVWVGHGYLMRKNRLVELSAPVPEVAPHHSRVWDVHQISLQKEPEVRLASPIKVTRLSIVQDAPPVVVDRDSLSLFDIAYNAAIPSAMLPAASQRLHGTVSGRDIALRPEDAAAINFSLDTPGMSLHERVEKKRKDHPDEPGRVYIRVTIGPDEGNSPGVPFVLEIWPRGCYSAIHDHAGTVAVIKVLHGDITVRWFNPLAKDDNPVKPEPFGQATFHEGAVTWLTPEMYQTHQLVNERRDTMCATIQCYRYLDGDDKHYEFFDYLDTGKPERHRFKPTSDYDFITLMGTVREEYRKSRLR